MKKIYSSKSSEKRKPFKTKTPRSGQQKNSSSKDIFSQKSTEKRRMGKSSFYKKPGASSSPKRTQKRWNKNEPRRDKESPQTERSLERQSKKNSSPKKPYSPHGKLSKKEREKKKQEKKEFNKRYYKKTDDNYLSKRYKRDSKNDTTHKPVSPLVRINKYLYTKNICSRREADTFIEKGLVVVNGKKAIIGQKVHPLKDKIVLHKTLLTEVKNKIVVAFHKPKGYVSSNPQEDEKDAASLLPFSEKLSPIGRLDKNTTGLLLLTNDGKIVNKLLHPDFAHEKEYIVTVDKRITPTLLKKMKEGIDIGGYITKKARVKKIDDYSFSLVLTEGKNHQIKKMTNALGFTVRELKRTRFNNIKLAGIKSGKFRVIEGKEYLKLVEKF